MKLSVKVGIGTSSYTTEVYENDLFGFVCELLEKHDKISIAIGINYCDFNKDYSKSAISEKLQKFASKILSKSVYIRVKRNRTLLKPLKH